jgi:hypothetical protein
LFTAVTLIVPCAAPANDPLPWYAENLGLNLGSLTATAPVDSSSHVHFGYTYLEVGAMQFDPDGVSKDVDSYYARASLSLLDFLHIFGEYQRQDLDISSTSTDQFALGAGVHFSVLHNLDLLGEASWLYQDATSDVSTYDDNTNGYELFAGARWMALPWHDGGLELNGGVGYIDLDSRLASDDTTEFWQAGLRLHFLRSFSIGALYEQQGDDDGVAANLRFTF